MQSWDLDVGFPDHFNGRRNEVLARATELHQRLQYIPFLRPPSSSIAETFYTRVLHRQPLAMLPLIPVNVVRPKAIRQPVGKENQGPARKPDNPEDSVKPTTSEKTRAKLESDVKPEAQTICTAELESCMDYPPRFAKFIA